MKNMQTSPNGRRFIEGQEGLKLKVYPDFRKPPQPTIGYGHALRSGESFPNGITPAQADAILANDLRIAESAINAHVTVQLAQGQFDALVSLTFNEGGSAIANSTLLRILNTGDYAGAAAHFPEWDKVMSNGRLEPSPVLDKRRALEMEMFLDASPDSDRIVTPPDVA